MEQMLQNLVRAAFLAGGGNFIPVADAFIAGIQAGEAQATLAGAYIPKGNIMPALLRMVDCLRSNQKIGAIKELRTLTGGGLRECKDFVDLLGPVTGHQPY
jgi:ribosomal protein L7/L12